MLFFIFGVIKIFQTNKHLFCTAGMTWNKTKPHGTKQNHLVQDRTTWNKTEPHGTKQNHMEQNKNR